MGVPQFRAVELNAAAPLAAVTHARAPSIQADCTGSRLSTRANVFDVPSATIASVIPVRGLLGSVPQKLSVRAPPPGELLTGTLAAEKETPAAPL